MGQLPQNAIWGIKWDNCHKTSKFVIKLCNTLPMVYDPSIFAPILNFGQNGAIRGKNGGNHHKTSKFVISSAIGFQRYDTDYIGSSTFLGTP